MTEAFVRVEDLRVSFPTEDGIVRAVDGLSFHVEDGAIRERDALLEPGRGHGAVTHDREAAVTAHLAHQGADLARADVDADEDRFSFHRLSCSVRY